MYQINRVSLFGKLNPTLYKSIESATAFAKLRSHAYVELGHWLHQILQLNDSDLHRILAEFDVEPGAILQDLAHALDGLPRGATAISDLSDHIDHAVERAWSFASLAFNVPSIRSGVLLYAMLATPSLKRQVVSLSPLFDRISPERLSERFAAFVAASPEAVEYGGADREAETSAANGAPGDNAQSALERFTVDLTEKARAGELDPVECRDDEIHQVIDILLRRRQNNPLLTGEAGVGKTAVVEGLALRLVSGEVPPILRNVCLRTLDIGLLQAGASMKGEFEDRLRKLIDGIQRSTVTTILFIDEIHTIVGAGGSAGTGDAANLLKPMLARGTLRTIGATTWSEYKKYIEKDPALTRRFQVVQVLEPDEQRAIRMVRTVAPALQRHHQVLLLNAAIEAAVRLSHRYIPSRQLPDKAVSLLDTTCARVAISQHALPPELENCLSCIDALTLEKEMLGREARYGAPQQARMAEIDSAVAASRALAATLNGKYEQSRTLVAEIVELRSQLDQARNDEGEEIAQATQQPATSADLIDDGQLLERLQVLETELSALQGDSPLVFAAVDAQSVAAVVADWTGIPVGRMVKDEIAAVLSLADALEMRVIGQRHALEVIASRVQTSRAKLDDPCKPVGVFLLCGPSGVGKTETALALAETLYGGEQNLITINMSEFQESHTVSTLKGAPPGYVGYGEGGVLTEAVRRRPHSVVLLDEVEKAHPDVHEIFFQVFDKGWMEDGEGRYIDFRNTIILLTANVGTELTTTLCRDPELLPSAAALVQALRQPLLKVFPAALLGRLLVVPYFPLSDATLAAIIHLQLTRIGERIRSQHGARLEYEDSLVDFVASRCQEVESGGRMVDSILTNVILPEISRECLRRMTGGVAMTSVGLSASEGRVIYAYG
jgi:type VI secretion system protein VasG